MEDIELLSGESIFSNPIPSYKNTNSDYRISGTFRNKSAEIVLNNDILSRNLLLLGSAGSGKSTAIYQILNRIYRKFSSNDVMLIFDTKGDYYDKFKNQIKNQNIIVIGNAAGFEGCLNYWNIFKEIEADGSDEVLIKANAKEISSVLFEGRGSETQPFFVNAATDLFACLLVGFRRLVNRNRISNPLTNGGFLRFYNEMAEDAARFSFFLKDFSDLSYAISYIGDGSSGQAQGVLGEMSNMISDVFVGSFAAETELRNYSMRSLIRNKSGKSIFLEYDMNTGETLVPIYRLMIDLALKEALSRGRGEARYDSNVWIIADEFRLLPKLKHIDDALNFGRSLGVKVIAGIQTIKQLEYGYGESRASSIAAGFSSTFVFKLNDSDSRKFASELLGETFKIYKYPGIDGVPVIREREGYVAEKWDLLDIRDPGLAAVRIDGKSPFLFKFSDYK